MANINDKENKEYLDKTVRPILEKLIPDILLDRPKELYSYMKKWLERNESCFLLNEIYI